MKNEPVPLSAPGADGRCPRCGGRSLHWSIRWGVPLFIGGLAGLALGITVITQHFYSSFSRPEVLLSGFLMMVLLQAIPIGLYALLTRRYGPRPPVGEVLCRRCGYILRGITEPRCPECGERI